MATKELFFEGKTLDAALETAAAELGADKDLLTYELVQAPTKGLFGLGGTKAKIKVEVEVPDAPKAEPKAEKPKAQPAKMPANFEPEKISKKQPKEKKAEKPVKSEPIVFERKLTPVEEGDEDAKKIEAFILGLLEKLEITDGSVTVSYDESGDYFAEVAGSKMGVIIGRRGETLDAVQYLTNLVVTRGKEKKVIIDSENYRAKRITTIVNLANKTADKAIKYKKNQSLEPMSAYERRIIHTALADREHIATHSVGSEPKRKVVITYKG